VVRVIVNMKFFFHALCFLVRPLLPVPLFLLALSRKLVTMADALLGVVHIDLLLLLCKILFPHIKKKDGCDLSVNEFQKHGMQITFRK
jgi:hypothetical protein